ncbi:MAG: 50S ribosomal protein L23 [Trueperaceae bacterium]|jgi:large subunit ribosomal protein L23|nr:MAG: 50S ribosomal protein L23 [Trueperaceae bacterium]
MNPHDVLLRPVLSEKAVGEIEAGKYAFFVHPSANRTQVKDAVERVFNVEVVKINIANVRPKDKRLGRYVGQTPRRKKAIVTLAAGQRIQQLEGLT